MKTDITLLIEHLQAEVDYLKFSMDECSAELDFDGAKAFREPLILTQRKLNILKCLENPNYKRISKRKGMISRLEKSLKEKKFEIDNVDDQTRKIVEKQFKESINCHIEKSKIELKKLQSQFAEQRIDNDEIIGILEGLEGDEIKLVEFEIKKGKINLVLNIDNNRGVFKFRSLEGKDVNYYLSNSGLLILSKLGFDLETYEKKISNYKVIDKMKILEELAIIYYEVLEVFGEEINLKIE